MVRLSHAIGILQLILAGETLAEWVRPPAYPPYPPWDLFYSEKLQVEWQAATNSLPATVAVLKVVPTSFSPAVISNVIALTSFTSNDCVQSLAPHNYCAPSSRPEEKPPAGSVFFRSRDEKSTLSIVPYYGGIRLSAPDSFYPAFDFENVPDQARAYDLATNILRQLELPPSEVQIRNDQQPRVTFAAGTLTRQGVSHRDRMQVGFGRRLDRIDCFVKRTLDIEFGAHERVTKLELRWPMAQVEKRYPMATADQMIAWIKEGRARMQSWCDPMGVRAVEPKEIKRLIVKGINLYYSDVTYWPEDGDEKVTDRFYPFAILDTELELGPADTESVPLFCPVISEGLPPVSHQSCTICIYPSKQSERRRQPSSEQAVP